MIPSDKAAQFTIFGGLQHQERGSTVSMAPEITISNFQLPLTITISLPIPPLIRPRQRQRMQRNLHILQLHTCTRRRAPDKPPHRPTILHKDTRTACMSEIIFQPGNPVRFRSTYQILRSHHDSPNQEILAATLTLQFSYRAPVAIVDGPAMSLAELHRC